MPKLFIPSPREIAVTVQLASRRHATVNGPNRRTGYIGWLRSDNLGDLAMFEAVQRLMPTLVFEHFGGARKEHLLNKANLSGTRYFDSLVLGGGTLINESYLATVEVGLAQGLRMRALGTGVGSSGFSQAQEVDIADWKLPLEKFEKIGVRGPLSKKRLSLLGIGNVEVIGDLALALVRDKALPPSDTPSVAVSLAVPEQYRLNALGHPMTQGLAVALKEMTSSGWHVVPVAMSSEDVAPLAQLLENVLGVPPLLAPYTTAETFFSAIAGCTLTLAVRLHAAVLSACVGVPPVILGYRDKCQDFAESMELGAWHVDAMSTEASEIGRTVLRLAQSAREAPQVRWNILNRAIQWKHAQRTFAQWDRSVSGASNSPIQPIFPSNQTA